MPIQYFKITFDLEGRESTFKVAAESESAAEILLGKYFPDREIKIICIEAGRWKVAA